MLIVNAIVARYSAWKLFNKTRNELNRLDDRMLADIGFSRSEIDRVASQVSRA